MYWLFWVVLVLGTQRTLTLGGQLMSCQVRAALVALSSWVTVIATLRCETYWYMILEMTAWALAMLYSFPQATSLKNGQTRILTPKSAVVATSCVCCWNLKVRPKYCTWGRSVFKASTWLRLRLRVDAIQRGLDKSLILIDLQLQKLLFPRICFEFSEPPWFDFSTGDHHVLSRGQQVQLSFQQRLVCEIIQKKRTQMD